jgi:tetratricopeptide (TPR) repeat protein
LFPRRCLQLGVTLMISESIETLCQKARQAVAQGDNEQARQFYAQALALKPDAPDVHYGLATVCFLVNDLRSAAHHFREVTRLDPLRAGAHINLGAVYNRLDMVDEAIQVLRRGIQLDTRRAEGFYNLGLAYRRKRQLELAVQAYQEAARLNPRMADAHLNLANAYLDSMVRRLLAISRRSRCGRIGKRPRTDSPWRRKRWLRCGSRCREPRPRRKR